LIDLKAANSVRTMNHDPPRESIHTLIDLLEDRGVDYVFIGGIAMLAYIEGRDTHDIDIIVSAADLAKVPEIKILDETPPYARATLGELPIDLLYTSGPIFELVMRSYATQQRIAQLGREVPCATVEGLLLLKLYALPEVYGKRRLAKARAYEKDIADLTAGRNLAIAPIFEELSKLMPARSQ
jgi:hypothetical protein